MMKRGPHSNEESHPALELLLDYLEGKVPAVERPPLESHLESCERCRTEMSTFGLLLENLATERRDAPPAVVAEWARSLPDRARTTGRPGWLTLVADTWAEFTASLHSPIVAPQPVPALRGAGDIPRRSGRRRLLFAAGRLDLDLEIGYSAASEPRRLSGQVLPVGESRALWAGSIIRLTRGRAVAARAKLDRRGEFVLPRVKPGRYALELSGPSSARTPAFEV